MDCLFCLRVAVTPGQRGGKRKNGKDQVGCQRFGRAYDESHVSCILFMFAFFRVVCCLLKLSNFNSYSYTTHIHLQTMSRVSPFLLPEVKTGSTPGTGKSTGQQLGGISVATRLSNSMGLWSSEARVLGKKSLDKIGKKTNKLSFRQEYISYVQAINAMRNSR